MKGPVGQCDGLGLERGEDSAERRGVNRLGTSQHSFWLQGGHRPCEARAEGVGVVGRNHDSHGGDEKWQNSGCLLKQPAGFCGRIRRTV